MANQQHLDVLKQGKVAWNEWRKKHPDIRPDLNGADLSGVDFKEIDFTEANLKGAHLENANLAESFLERAYLREAHLKGANLETAHLEGARLFKADLTGCNLRFAYFDRTCNLDSISLNEASIADVRWGDVNLALVAWERVDILGDELNAKDQKIPKRNSSREDKNNWLRAYRKAIRANRQVATILRAQGLNEKADEFDYRAQVLQRKLLYRQGLWKHRGLHAPKLNEWQRIQIIVSSRVSWLLDFVAGYGYRPWRWFRLYLLTIIVFAVFHYSAVMPLPGAFSVNIENFHAWLNAISMSILNLHGRPFLSSTPNTQGAINTIEAFVGLFVEAILIAIITQRILGKSGA